MRQYHLPMVVVALTCGAANAQTRATPYSTLQQAGAMLSVARAAPPTYESSLPTRLPVTQSEMKFQQFGTGYHDSPYLIAAQGQSPAGAAPGAEPDAKGGEGGQDVASKFTDPTALLTSYQFVTQYNPIITGTNGSGVQFLFRPVIPIPKSDLIPVNQVLRIVAPINSAIDVSPTEIPGGQLPGGFGDVQVFDLFVLPVSKTFTFGVGPVAIFPTATTVNTGQGHYQLGPAIVLLYTGIPKWQMGILAQQLFSIGSNERRSVNQMIYQAIMTRHFEKGWYLGLCGQPAVIDWRSGHAQFPAGFGVGRVFAINKQLVNFSVTPTYYVGATDLQPRWQIQFNFSLIYGK